MRPTIAERLAKFSHDLSFEDLPPEAVDKAKLLILDTVGVCISSAGMDFGEAALTLLNRWGGTAESTLIGTDTKVPAHNAAFYNGVLAHGQDYDDTHTESVVHPSCVLVPAALAAAERDGRSGRDLIAALAVGTETAIRLGIIAPNFFHQHGWHATSVCATFGATVSAARLHGLDVGLTAHAIGISGSFASGLLEYITAGSGVKRLHPGWVAQGGIVAVDTAECGFTGPPTVFEGQFGFYNSFLHGEDLDLELIFDGLGDRWDIMDIRPKLYPCCHYLQAFLDCAADLRKEGLEAERIDRIECHVPEGAVNIVCEPWDSRLQPENGYAARFSLPFAISTMFALGRAGPAEFTGATFSNPVIRGLMEKVSYAVDPRYDVKDMPARVEVTLADGTRQTRELPEVRGSSRSPFSRDELLGKFRVNTEAFPAADGEKLAELILDLENLDNVSGLLPDFAQGGMMRHAG